MTENIIEWDLSDFYQGINDSQIEKDMNTLLAEATKFNSTVKGKLNNPELSSSQLLEWFKEYERLGEKVFYLVSYSQLIYSTNTLDDEVKAFHAKIDEYKVKIQELMLFF